MFAVIAIGFLVFTILYAAFAGLIIYHVKEFSLTSHPMPRKFTAVFITISCALWVVAFYLLLLIRVQFISS